MNSSPGTAHGSASAGWAVVTASGIVQSRCGRRMDGKPPTACPAWRLSRPGMSAWRPCFACGSGQVPVPIEAALVEVTAAVARVIGGHQGAR
jgi:hypothetical protein